MVIDSSGDVVSQVMMKACPCAGCVPNSPVRSRRLSTAERRYRRPRRAFMLKRMGKSEETERNRMERAPVGGIVESSRAREASVPEL
jgi:hypothetical protein